MKWTFLVGILGLAIGFLVGRSEEKVVENEEGEAVVRSERRVGSRGGRSREVGDSERGRSRVDRMIREAGMSEEEMTEISRARLMKWILELEAADFPEVLESLVKLRVPGDPDPFAAGPSSSDYLTVAMARWYELEGEIVLDWVLAEPEVLEGMRTESLLLDMIRDGYEKNPTLSFQLMKKHSEVLKGRSDFGTLWCYQIGRWSRDFAMEYEEVEAMAKELGFDFESGEPDPFADASARPGPSLIRGMVDAGRGQEVREFFAQKEPEMLGELDSLLENRKLDRLEKQGWQAVKAAIDSGEVEGSEWQAANVLNQWAKEEPEKALAWFLDQEAEDGDRAFQITRAVLSSAFEMREGDRSKWNIDAVIKFLGQMETEGEPTGEAWGELTERIVRQEHWLDLKKLKSKVSPDQWETALKLVERRAVGSDSIQMGHGDWIEFQKLKGADLQLLDYFGIKERVLQGAAEQNAKSLRELQETLGLE